MWNVLHTADCRVLRDGADAIRTGGAGPAPLEQTRPRVQPEHAPGPAPAPAPAPTAPKDNVTRRDLEVTGQAANQVRFGGPAAGANAELLERVRGKLLAGEPEAGMDAEIVDGVLNKLAGLQDPQLARAALEAILAGNKEDADAFINFLATSAPGERDVEPLLQQISTASNAQAINELVHDVNNTVGALQVELDFSRRCQFQQRLSQVEQQLDYLEQASKQGKSATSDQGARFREAIKAGRELIKATAQQPDEARLKSLADHMRSLLKEMKQVLPASALRNVSLEDHVDKLVIHFKQTYRSRHDVASDFLSMQDARAKVGDMEGQLRTLAELQAAQPPDPAAIEQAKQAVERLAGELRHEGVIVERLANGTYGYRCVDTDDPDRSLPPAGSPPLNAHGVNNMLKVLETRDQWENKGMHLHTQARTIEQQIQQLTKHLEEVKAAHPRLTGEAAQVVEFLNQELAHLRAIKATAEQQAARLLDDMAQINKAQLILCCASEQCLNLAGFPADKLAALQRSKEAEVQGAQRVVEGYLHQFGMEHDPDSSPVGEAMNLAARIEKQSLVLTTSGSDAVGGQAELLLARKQKLDELLADSDRTAKDAQDWQKLNHYVQARGTRTAEELPPPLRAIYDRLQHNPSYRLPTSSQNRDLQQEVGAMGDRIFGHLQSVTSQAIAAGNDVNRLADEIAGAAKAPAGLKALARGIKQATGNGLQQITGNFMRGGLALGHSLAELSKMMLDLVSQANAEPEQAGQQARVGAGPAGQFTPASPAAFGLWSIVEAAHENLLHSAQRAGLSLLGLHGAGPDEVGAEQPASGAPDEQKVKQNQVQVLLEKASAIYKELQHELEQELQKAADQRKDRGLAQKDLVDELHDEAVGSHDEVQEAFFKAQRLGKQP